MKYKKRQRTCKNFASEKLNSSLHIAESIYNLLHNNKTQRARSKH